MTSEHTTVMARVDKYGRPTKVVLFWFYLFVFTRDSIYAIARICYRPSVRPSVRLSDGCIIDKRLKLRL